MDEVSMDFEISLPSSDKTNTVIKTDDKKPNTISSNNQWDLPLERNEFSSDKEYNKFVNTVTRTVRSSVEYREWTDYLKQELNMNDCVISEENGDEVTIEIHHHPVGLFDIVKVVTNKMMEENKTFTSCDIVKEVLKLHFNNNVGYTALVTTLHEKFHNGHLNIPIDLCHGNYSYLLDNYTFDDEQSKKIASLIKVKSSNQKWPGKK